MTSGGTAHEAGTEGRGVDQQDREADVANGLDEGGGGARGPEDLKAQAAADGATRGEAAD